MNRSTVAWTLVAFFGASLAFNAVQDLTRDEPIWVTLLIEVGVLAAIVAFIVVLVRARG